MKKLITALLLSLVLTLPLAAMAAVNINTADATTLASELPGIGLSKANAIVQYRTEKGDFEKIEDLVNVPGIGEKTLEKIRPLITIGETGSSSTPTSGSGGTSGDSE